MIKGLCVLLTGMTAVAVTAAPPNSSIVLSPAQLFDVAERLKKAGRVAEAETTYEALSTNPDVKVRSEARFRLAMMLSTVGREREATALLRRILDEQPGAQRARIELAAILAKLGRVSDAQRELRAAQASGLPPEAARFVDRFSAGLRARAPYGASIGFAIAPDTNINRGTQLDRLGTVFGDFLIGKDAKRRSGVGLSADGEAFVRRRISGHASLLAKAAASMRLYRRSEFNDIAFAPGIGPELELGADRLTLSATASRRWFGGRRYSDSIGLEGNYQHPLKGIAVLRGAIAAYHVDNHANDLEDGAHIFVTAGGELGLGPRSGVGLSSTVIRRDLRDGGYSNWGIYPTIYGWREAGRLTVSASVTAGHLWADDRLLIYPRKRTDDYLRIGVSGVLRRFTFAGFAPSLQFMFERNRSTVAVYDYRRRAAEIGFSRVF